LGDTRSVAIISAVNPYPSDYGKRVVLAGFVEYWSRRLGPADTHYVLVHKDPPTDTFPVTLHRVDPPTTRERLGAVAGGVLTGRSSLQEAMLSGASLRRSLATVLDQVSPDLVIFDTIRLGQYAPRIPPRAGQRRMVYLDDLFSLRYAAMLEAGRTYPDITYDALGTFAHLIPGPLRRPVSWRPVQRTLLSLERRLVARSEAAATTWVDTCLLINPGEADVLRTRAGGDVRVTPPLLGLDEGGPRTWAGNPTFVCLGNLVLPHNADGVRWFLASCMPDLARRMPGARVRIIGRGAPQDLLDLASRFPQVTVEGYVEDLDSELASAAALLAPMRFGSGIKIKIVDALARGLPVITTRVGAHGIGLGAEHGLVVEDRIEAYPEAMAAVCEADRNAALSAAARAHFTSTFSRASVTEAYDRAFS